MQASPGGTHWWHAHTDTQREDGAFGAFIVKQAPKRDVHSDLYDYDLPEHVVFIQDWLHEPTISRLAAFPPSTTSSDTLIINGKGHFQSFSTANATAFTPREVFHVKQGERYRFRIIGNNKCHLAVEVESHRLTAIATDGSPIKPVAVDRIGLTSGERYDFVLTADQDVGNYWFRLFTTDPGCPRVVKEEFAILRYNGAPKEEPSEEFAEDNVDSIYLNPRSTIEIPEGIDVVEMQSAGRHIT